MTTAAPSSPKVAPCPSGHWLFGVGPDVAERPLETLTELAKLGDVVDLRFGVGRGFLISNPEYIKHVLHNPKIYGKDIVTYHRLRELIGLGLITSEGDFWLRQRRIEQPAFHKQRIAGFAAAMVGAAEAATERWSRAAEKREAIDIADEMTRVTMQIVCETLLGADAGAEGEQASRAFAELNELTADRAKALVALPLWIPTATNRHYRASLSQLDDAVYRIIARRRAEKEEGSDLLSMLMHARDTETGESMTDLQLRDEVTTILLAGHETTAVALSWTFHLLSQNPQAEERLRTELTTVLAGRAPTVADLERLPYLRMVIDESLRLYPPVFVTVRGMRADDDLDGYRIPKGALIFVSAWVVHRSPALWEEPLAFRPERFAPERRKGQHHYTYFPFIGGPRQCIGNTFALMEAQLVLATLLQRFRLTPKPDHPPIVAAPLMTLRPRPGVYMIPTRLP